MKLFEKRGPKVTQKTCVRNVWWPEPTCHLLSQFAKNCIQESLGGGFKCFKVHPNHSPRPITDSPDFVEHFTCPFRAFTCLFVKHLYLYFEYSVFVAWNQAPFSEWSRNGTTICAISESSRHVSTHAFLGTAQSCKVSEFQSYHICCFGWFFTWSKNKKNTTWSFVCNSELLLICRRLTASAFPGSWKLASLRCFCNIQSHRNLLGFHTSFDGNGNWITKKHMAPDFDDSKNWTCHPSMACCQCQPLVSQESLWPKRHIRSFR